MTKGGKVLLGVATAGAAAALFLLLRKRSSALAPSDPSEWSLPSFTRTSEFLSPALSPAPSPCSCGSGFTPIRRADGSCNCSPLSSEVIRYASIGDKCTASAQCAPGTVCINGSCRPESEWLES